MTDTLFISAGPIEWGSSRMRCYWPSKHMDADVVVWPYPKQIQFETKYNNYIFQKYGNPDIQRQLLEMGASVWLDECDPMWWFSDQEFMRSLFENATGATFSSEALRLDFLDWWGEDYNAHTIKDRLDFDHFKNKKVHHWTNPVRLIWYGVSQNRVALSSAWANLSRLMTNGHNITLTVMDDRPMTLIDEQKDVPIFHTTWNLDREVAMIAGHDIALLPAYPGPWGKVKSNNKDVYARACNVPVTNAQDYKELEKLVTSHEYRKQLADIGSAGLDEYDVKLTAHEWEQLLD